jgi:hypothetical protein
VKIHAINEVLEGIREMVFEILNDHQSPEQDLMVSDKTFSLYCQPDDRRGTQGPERGIELGIRYTEQTVLSLYPLNRRGISGRNSLDLPIFTRAAAQNLRELNEVHFLGGSHLAA